MTTEPDTGPVMPQNRDPADAGDGPSAEVVTERLESARLTALQLTSTGIRVSRRALREAGVKGSNEELSTLVKIITAELSASTTPS